MAGEKHIADLTIENFKRFADFEVKNLGQFNLIVGDNNTGKTSFLEALLMDEDVYETIKYLRFSLWQRTGNDGRNTELKAYLYDKFNMFLNRESTHGEIRISYYFKNGINSFILKKLNYENDLDKISKLEREKLLIVGTMNDFLLSLDEKVSTTLSLNQKVSNKYFPFIAFGVGHEDDLVSFYGRNIDVNITIRNTFIKNLKSLIPKVNDIRIGGNVINIYEEGVNVSMPLYTYGEGANKLFRILCEIAMCQGKRLMIDEIDAGIHHSRFKSFWRTIMQAAKAYDVQIFATTHNIECVEYFREVLEEERMEEYQDLARIVSLKVKKDNAVKATVYDFEAMKMANKTDYELRGGGL